jgi:hypothetical protein
MKNSDTFLEIIGGVALGLLTSLLFDVVDETKEQKEEFNNETEDLGYAIIVEDEVNQIK